MPFKWFGQCVSYSLSRWREKHEKVRKSLTWCWFPSWNFTVVIQMPVLSLCIYIDLWCQGFFFQMVLNFSDFQQIFANFSAILVFSLTSLQTHRKAKPQSRLLWHFTVVLLGDFILISQILWFQRLRRFRVVSLHSVGSSENPQGA